MEERRRAPRHVLDYGEFVGLPFSLTVQVMDITTAGVLLQSPRSIDVGARGALRLTIGDQSLTTEVAITRVSPATAGSDAQFRIGAKFTGISPEHRRLIERFTH
jgi:hypothetical protein